MRIAICDNQPMILQELKRIIENCFAQYDQDHEITALSSGKLLLNSHLLEPFDVVFLDIDMPYVTGFDVARKLRDVGTYCYIIFVTSHDNLVYESLDFQPFHFIRKNPIQLLELSIQQVVAKLKHQMNQQQTIVLEDDRAGRIAVLVRDIQYLESQQHYMNYVISKQSFPIKIRKTMSCCQEEFRDYNFIRIHKSYLINLRHIAYLDNRHDQVFIEGREQALPVSRKYKKQVDQQYTMYLRAIK